MNYFRDGGFGMWLMLASFLATVVVAIVRPRVARPGIFTVGCIAQLIEGMFGMAMGMMAVAHYVGRNPDATAQIVGQGLGELANNGTFGAGLASTLGIAALLTGRSAAND